MRKMNFCWHNWKETTVRGNIENVSPCCGKVHSIEPVRVILKECKKCGKSKAWRIYEKGNNIITAGTKLKADVEWAKKFINHYAEQNKT